MLKRAVLALTTKPMEAPVFETPAAYGLPFEDVTFASSDGVRLSGWLIRGSVPLAAAFLLLGALLPAAAMPNVDDASLALTDCAVNVGSPLARKRLPMEKIMPDIYRHCARELKFLSKVYPADIVLDEVMVVLEEQGAQRARKAIPLP